MHGRRVLRALPEDEGGDEEEADLEQQPQDGWDQRDRRRLAHPQPDGAHRTRLLAAAEVQADDVPAVDDKVGAVGVRILFRFPREVRVGRLGRFIPEVGHLAHQLGPVLHRLTGHGHDRVAFPNRVRLVRRVEKLGVEVVDDQTERAADADFRRGDHVSQHAEGVGADQEGGRHDEQPAPGGGLTPQHFAGAAKAAERARPNLPQEGESIPGFSRASLHPACSPAPRCIPSWRADFSALTRNFLSPLTMRLRSPSLLRTFVPISPLYGCGLSRSIVSLSFMCS